MLVLLLLLRLVDETIVLPNGGVIQRYDWSNGDSTVVLPNGGIIHRYEWRDDPPVTPRVTPRHRRWDEDEGDEEDGE